MPSPFLILYERFVFMSKKQKFKNLIFKKILPLSFIIVLFVSCFCLTASATAYITDDNKLFHSDQLSDIMTNASTNTNSYNYLVLGSNEGALPTVTSPMLYYTGFERAMPTGTYRISGLFNYSIASNVVSQYGTDFLDDNKFYTFNIPLMFKVPAENSSSLPSRIEFSLLNSNKQSIDTYIFNGVPSVVNGLDVVTYTINFNIKGDTVRLIEFFRIRMDIGHKYGSVEYIYGGLPISDNITIRNETNIANTLMYGWNSIVYTGDAIKDYESFQKGFLAYSKDIIDYSVDYFNEVYEGGSWWRPLDFASQVFQQFHRYGYSPITNIIQVSFVLGSVGFLLSISIIVVNGIGKIKGGRRK